MNQIIYIEVGTKKYPLVISPCTDPEDIKLGGIYVKCEEADLDQTYAKADLPLLLEDLPDMIRDFQSEKKDNSLLVRLSGSEKVKIEDLASKNGFKNVSAYIRTKALQD